jgi:hypothetical protein
MLKQGEPNPLNVHQLRQVNHCPPHFEKVIVDLPNIETKQITDWLYENLEGRFYVGIVDAVSTGWPHAESTGYERYVLVGFEIPSEATYFTLTLPTLDTH